MNSEQFRKIISGESRGLISALWFCLFYFISVPLSVVVRIRNFLYDKNILTAHRVSIPAVSVGNLTLGGTGKSPMCAYLVRYFLDKGHQPSIISRGYGHSSSKNNDEFLELALQFPDVLHIQNPDRIAAAKEILALQRTPPIDILILDDAMQHRRIFRNINIVLLDAAEPFGFNRIFPAGFLREPVSELCRADAIILTRSDSVSEEKIAAIKQHCIKQHCIEQYCIEQHCNKTSPNFVWAETVHSPQVLLTLQHQSVDLSVIIGKRVFAFCGIGNPEAFRKTLSDCGADIAGFLSFPDHHRYCAEDIRQLKSEAVKCNADMLVCTVKDLVKIPPEEMKEHIIYAVSVQIRFIRGEEELKNLLQRIDTGKT
jgi:tetraacyldisaccharide 4'-kinase